MSVQGCIPFEEGRIATPIGHTRGAVGSVRGGLALLLVPALLAAAGIALSSSQDRAVGDLVAQSSSLGGQLTFYYGFVSALIFLSVAALSYRTVASICRNNLLLCSLITLAALSCVWSQSPIQTIKFAFLLCASMAFSFWLAASLSPKQQMKLLIQTGIVAALISIVVVLAIPSRGLDTMHEMAWQGAFFSKNHMGRMFLFFPDACYSLSGSKQVQDVEGNLYRIDGLYDWDVSIKKRIDSTGIVLAIYCGNEVYESLHKEKWPCHLVSVVCGVCGQRNSDYAVFGPITKPRRS